LFDAASYDAPPRDATALLDATARDGGAAATAAAPRRRSTLVAIATTHQ